MMHDISLSDNAIRFLKKVMPSLMLRADNADFLPDAEAVAEILKAVTPAPANAPDVQA